MIDFLFVMIGLHFNDVIKLYIKLIYDRLLIKDYGEYI